MAQREYKLLPASDINNFFGYDKTVAETHINNCGYIVVDAQYGDVIDNEYDLDEIFYEIKNKPIKMTESQFKAFIKESVANVLNEMGFKKRINESSGYEELETEIEVDFLKCAQTGEIAQLLDSDKLPWTVNVILYLEWIPYDKGDYYTPPYGGFSEIQDIKVDTTGEFKAVLSPELYGVFVNEVKEYVYDNEEKLIGNHDEDRRYGYDQWNEYDD